MKTLYLDCSMGAAGDMLAAGLLELHPDPDAVIRRLNGLGIPGVEYQLDRVMKSGIQGSHLTVKVNGQEEESMDVHDHHHDHDHDHDHHHDHDHDHDHHHDHGHDHAHDHDHDHPHDHAHDHDHHHAHSHHSMKDITRIVSALDLPDPVKADILSVYREIAEAEGHVHGMEPDQIHFHEVGTMDAVADVTAVCLLMHELGADQVVASAVHVGSGHVHCAHGILPVPAPATAYLLRGIPSYGGEIQAELCTPTGAALLRHFVKQFGSQPVMRIQNIGYGMGKKDFSQVNCVRAILGTVEPEDFSTGNQETIWELKCNLDDMTPEEIGFAQEILMGAGALDVFTVNIGMKKNRPGILLTCLCREESREQMLRLIFLHTTTLGVRETRCLRDTLNRESETLSSENGTVRVKTASGWGVTRAKPEYEDLARIARQEGISLREAKQRLTKETNPVV